MSDTNLTCKTRVCAIVLLTTNVFILFYSCFCQMAILTPGSGECVQDHYRTLYYNDKNETEHEVKKIIPHPNFGERLMPHDTKGKIFNAKYDIGKTSLSLTFPPGLSHEVTLLTFIKNCCLPLYSNIRNYHGFE